jgi:tRNA-splicing ligase RtcB
MWQLEKIDDYRWRLPATYKRGMRVPGVVYADERMLRQIAQDQALDQVANVATLPGIVQASYAMPDIHWGYGFPVGGVAAFDVDDGVIAAGGVGFDINCGTRIIRTDLTADEVRPRIERLADELFQSVPSGVGAEGAVSLRGKEIDHVLRKGAAWAIEQGYGWPEDLETIEERGTFRAADPDAVSARAKQRGAGQLGTIGSGNHFVTIDYVEAVYDGAVAAAFALGPVGQVVAFFHCGSRGLGHQVCDDYLPVMADATRQYRIELVDRQLACAPFRSDEGKRYFAAMAAGANFAWANRECITHFIRETFARVFRKSARELGMRLLYDVAHNIAKVEEHEVDGKPRRVVVHRKGATRAFPPGHPEVPEKYRAVGQPVLVPGDMGRYDFVCVGTEGAMRETFGSTCHGAGRLQSRQAAMKALKGVDLMAALKESGITVRVVSKRLLAEEASSAYKDVEDVVGICHRAGISRTVAKMRPLAVIKG